MNLRLAPTVPTPQEIAIVADPALAPSPQPMLACFGVACPGHGHCARYAAVDCSSVDRDTLVSCRSGDRFPLFIAIVGAARAVAA
jgi:hypothetical protein